MGAGQSSGRGAPSAEQEVKTSYYELLGVERQATDDEIKKAYRRKALELHPDRNYGNEETATKIFADVQAAYEVLSDPQERAWYDSHESAILRGDDGLGPDAAPSYHNVRVTTADDLARMLRKFNGNVEFSDAPSGFFGFIRETFEQLAKEEEAAAHWESADVPDYPSFGHKDDRYEDVGKRFYAVWSSFSTLKSFSWRDKYKLSEAPDRWYRRRMEKENKMFRQEGIKEFNEAVRALVAFIRKRDPRYVPSTQSEAERQKVLRDAAASQAARARAANAAKLDADTVPDWAKFREPEELGESEEEEAEQEVFECVACNKIFKSEKQWEAHEKSKKHQKAMQALQRKMRKENANLDLDDIQMSSGIATPEVDVDEEEELDVLDDLTAEVEDHDARTDGHRENAETNGDETTKGLDEADAEDLDSLDDVKASKGQLNGASTGESESEDSDYASPESIQARLQSARLDTPPAGIPEADAEEADTKQAAKEESDLQPAQPKMGKAAQKRAKKAAAAVAVDEVENQHKCATCSAAFPSKTRLFQHIKDHNHAVFKPAASGGGKGVGKKAKGKR